MDERLNKLFDVLTNNYPMMVTEAKKYCLIEIGTGFAVGFVCFLVAAVFYAKRGDWDETITFFGLVSAGLGLVIVAVSIYLLIQFMVNPNIYILKSILNN